MNSSTTELAQPSISFYVCISQAAPLLSSNTNTIMRLWRIHSGGEKNAKNNEIVKRQQQQQAAANNPRVFGRTSRKERKQSYSVVREPVRVPGTYHMKDTFDNQPRTNLRRGLLHKAVTTRDRCVAHMLLRSCRDVRRPRHLPNAKTAASLESHPDGTTENKYRISDIPRLDRYTNIK